MRYFLIDIPACFDYSIINRYYQKEAELASVTAFSCFGEYSPLEHGFVISLDQKPPQTLIYRENSAFFDPNFEKFLPFIIYLGGAAF